MSLEPDQHGYVSLGLFLFGVCLFAVATAVALVAWAFTSVPILLGVAMATAIFGVWFIWSTLRGRV